MDKLINIDYVLKKEDAKIINPQVLAFVGDGVYSLYIRHKILLSENIKGKELHSQVTNYVKAKGQSDFIERLLPTLSEEELAIAIGKGWTVC